MHYDGTLEQLLDAVGSIKLVKSTEQPNTNHIVLRTSGGCVVNWFRKQKRVNVQGKKAEIPSFTKQLAERLATPASAATDKTDEGQSASSVAYRRRQSNPVRPQAIYTPDKDSELVIALVGAVGTDLSIIASVITERLKTFNYTTTTIKISQDIISEFLSIPDTPEFDRISSLMTAGNDFRKNTQDFAILAKLAVAKINETRLKGKTPGDIVPMPRRAFIISSLKHPDEVSALRKIYANGFFLFGVHANKKTRFEFLHLNKEIPEEKVEELFERDEDEAGKHGQHTRDTYHLSDFFVDFGDNRHKFERDVWRLLDLIFGKPFVTPTFDEFAMFMAFSASLRSADLSRQVGAVVTRDHAIVSTGANDVPKFGGGLYWPDYYDQAEIHDIPNGRDYVRTGDTNVLERNDIIADILAKVPDSQRDEIKVILSNSKLKNITEYGRVVHAEMEAILSCARTNIGTQGAHLYCTTFPCHNCAKHIVASGIAKVVYVEPYPKSKAAVFHDDSISLAETETGKVVFAPFVGVGPRSFFSLFSMNLGSGYEVKRKTDDGKPIKWEQRHAKLRMQMLPTSYLERENITTKQVYELLENIK